MPWNHSQTKFKVGHCQMQDNDEQAHLMAFSIYDTSLQAASMLALGVQMQGCHYKVLIGGWILTGGIQVSQKHVPLNSLQDLAQDILEILKNVKICLYSENFLTLVYIQKIFLSNHVFWGYPPRIFKWRDVSPIPLWQCPHVYAIPESACMFLFIKIQSEWLSDQPLACYAIEGNTCIESFKRSFLSTLMTYYFTSGCPSLSRNMDAIGLSARDCIAKYNFPSCKPSNGGSAHDVLRHIGVFEIFIKTHWCI